MGHTVKELGLDNYPELKPFEKTHYSMMIPEVEKYLKTEHPDVQNVVICGIESHVCVQCTVQSLINHGYDVHVVADGCSSRTMVDRYEYSIFFTYSFIPVFLWSISMLLWFIVRKILHYITLVYFVFMFIKKIVIILKFSQIFTAFYWKASYLCIHQCYQLMSSVN